MSIYCMPIIEVYLLVASHSGGYERKSSLKPDKLRINKFLKVLIDRSYKVDGKRFDPFYRLL